MKRAKGRFRRATRRSPSERRGGLADADTFELRLHQFAVERLHQEVVGAGVHCAGDLPKVVFCTSEYDVAQIARAMHAGADDFLMKPFDREHVQAKFESVGVC